MIWKWHFSYMIRWVLIITIVNNEQGGGDNAPTPLFLSGTLKAIVPRWLACGSPLQQISAADMSVILYLTRSWGMQWNLEEFQPDYVFSSKPWKCLSDFCVWPDRSLDVKTQNASNTLVYWGLLHEIELRRGVLFSFITALSIIHWYLI